MTLLTKFDCPKIVFTSLFFGLLLLCVQSYGQHKYGIAGMPAPDWCVDYWIDEDGEPLEKLELSDYEGKVVFMLGFQSWCPGCHSRGFPTLQKVRQAFEGDDRVAFVAVQTVFEGHHTNTAKKLRKLQQKYDLPIPFGHDVGNATTRNRSHILTNYRTGGTPWIIITSPEGLVVFNDYHISASKAIQLIRAMLKQGGSR